MMSSKLGLSLTVSGMLVLMTATACAQEAPAGPPPPRDAMVQNGGPETAPPPGPFAERMELLGFEGMRGGKVVTGAPFSAVATSQSTQTLADGNQIARKIQTNLFRDGQGRVRKEMTFPAVGWLAPAGQPRSFVVISDPVEGTEYVLDPNQKTARELSGLAANRRGLVKDKFGARMRQEIASGALKSEDLGTQTIGGVVAQGTRYTRTIPAGQIGNEKPITIVSERWYSNDLQMVVMNKLSDPRFGETTYTLTNIQRGEPNASLFQVPSDYTLKQGGMRRHRRMGLKAAPPPPPSN